MACPPKPGEVTEAGGALTCAWPVAINAAETANAAKSAPEADFQRRTASSYSEFEVMAHLDGRTPLST
jgi:hypothetical protein